MKWFKHFSNASSDEFMVELEELFGLEGVARWWKLLEAVSANVDPKKGNWSTRYSWSKWQTLLRGKRKKLETFLEHLENKTRINLEQNGNFLEIRINNLTKYCDNYTKDLQASGNKLPSQEEEVEEDKEREEESTLTGTCPQTSSAGPPRCPHQEIIALYHEVLPELRKVRVWDANREKLLRARWKSEQKRQSLDWWRGFFEYVRGCPFLMGLVDGREGKAPFQADLEWLVRPTNFNKVIEGKYEA